MEWNLNGISDKTEFYSILYNGITIANAKTTTHDETTPLVYFQKDNPFSQDRINGSLNLINGNGTVIFKLKDLRYDEDGVFELEIFITSNEKLGVSVKVQGKTLLKKSQKFEKNYKR